MPYPHMPLDGAAPPIPGTFAFLGAGGGLYGQPVYSSGPGLISLALANAIATSVVVGMIGVPSVVAGAFAPLVLSGQILTMTTAQWDAIAGTTGGLANNTTYYLSAAAAGHYTAASPATTGDTVVPLLYALSPTQAVVVIVPPVQL
jgi:hypothetical protein